MLWRDAPHLLSPRLELVFFSTLRTVSWDIERTTRRRFNSSHSICRVHRARPAGGSLQAMATNRASPSPSSTVAPLAAPLAAYQRSRQAVLHTALTHLLDRLSSDPHLLHYLSVGLSRSVFPLVCQQQDPRIPPPVGGLPSGLYQAGQFVPFFRAEADHVEFHFHPLPE